MTLSCIGYNDRLALFRYQSSLNARLNQYDIRENVVNIGDAFLYQIK